MKQGRCQRWLVIGLEMGYQFKIGRITRIFPSMFSESELASGRLHLEETTQKIVEKEGVGRNDPCPCASGKKYKKCHGYWFFIKILLKVWNSIFLILRAAKKQKIFSNALKNLLPNKQVGRFRIVELEALNTTMTEKVLLQRLAKGKSYRRRSTRNFGIHHIFSVYP